VCNVKRFDETNARAQDVFEVVSYSNKRKYAYLHFHSKITFESREKAMVHAAYE
jgi:hypothetical protein